MRVNRSKKDYTNIYKQCFETEAGLLVIADLAKKFKALQSVYDDSHAKMSLMEGQRNVVLFILSQISYNEEDAKRVMELINKNQMVNNYDRPN